jgi:hypothetical protein
MIEVTQEELREHHIVGTGIRIEFDWEGCSQRCKGVLAEKDAFDCVDIFLDDNMGRISIPWSAELTHIEVDCAPWRKK